MLPFDAEAVSSPNLLSVSNTRDLVLSNGSAHIAQVAASPEATYVSPDDVSPDFVEKETAIEMEKEDILSKPEAIRCDWPSRGCFRGEHDDFPYGAPLHYPSAALATVRPSKSIRALSRIAWQ